ncbi:MAG: biopolymer transporter ExbD [Bacteroidota bacterium]
MSKKPKRGVPAIDMTAMVDVAFLLLTFFILTTTSFREESKIEVDTPSSVSSLTPPEKGLLTISVGSEGQVFVGLTDIGTRQQMIERFEGEMRDRDPNFSLSPEGKAYFATLQEFGVPHEDLRKWLALDSEERSKFEHTGISPRVTDSTTMTGNDLKDWIRWGRMSDQRMRFAIKGDSKTEIPAIEDVISSLQDWDVNSFSLITALEEGPSEASIEN